MVALQCLHRLPYLQVISGITTLEDADAFARALVLSYYQGAPRRWCSLHFIGARLSCSSRLLADQWVGSGSAGQGGTG